jgi:hypothetical protein
MVSFRLLERSTKAHFVLTAQRQSLIAGSVGYLTRRPNLEFPSIDLRGFMRSALCSQGDRPHIASYGEPLFVGFARY